MSWCILHSPMFGNYENVKIVELKIVQMYSMISLASES